MYLKFDLNENGERVYTLKKKLEESEKPTQSAHPARFSPDDKHSENRVLIKKRYGELLTQKPKQSM